MASWDTYATVEDFLAAVRTKQVDVSQLTAHLDCGDFYVLDAQDEEVISGDEREVLPLFFTMLGIQIEQESGE